MVPAKNGFSALALLPLLLLLQQLLLSPTHSAVLSSSSLETCVQDGSAQSATMTCEKKLVLGLAIGGSQSLATEKLNFDVKCINSTDGACPCKCDYAKDDNCHCRDLTQPLTVVITKSPVFASYPMEYINSYNYHPHEIIMRPKDNTCSSADDNKYATCGWYYMGTTAVPDSQGFTCECSAGNIWDSTLGGGGNTKSRAGLDCDFFSNPKDILTGNPPCSAHCVDFDPMWYSGYQLGEAQMQFTIDVDVQIPLELGSGGKENGSSNGNNSTTSQILQLSPSVPLGRSDQGIVAARLLGDLVSYSQMPVFNNKVLMVPQPTDWTLDQVLEINRSQWMLVDLSMITRDGRECDKIGTAFNAFRYQPDGCKRAPQTCLANQLKDLQDGDSARVAKGQVPQYMITRYTYGSDSLLKNFNGGALSFALPVISEATSLLQLSVSADNVSFVVNSAPGRINSARVCSFDEVVCGGFESGASRGYLHVNISNVGSITSGFTVTVSNCSSNVMPVEARSLSLEPHQSMEILPPMQLYVEDPFAISERFCWIHVYNSQGLPTDSFQVTFFTNQTTLPPALSGKFNGTQDGAAPPAPKLACSEECKGSMDIKCMAQRGCWGSSAKFFGVIGGVVGTAAVVTVAAAKFGFLAGLLPFLKHLLCCGGGGAGMAAAGAGGDDGGGEGAAPKVGESTTTAPPKGASVSAPYKGGSVSVAPSRYRSTSTDPESPPSNGRYVHQLDGDNDDDYDYDNRIIDEGSSTNSSVGLYSNPSWGSGRGPGGSFQMGGPSPLPPLSEGTEPRLSFAPSENDSGTGGTGDAIQAGTSDQQLPPSSSTAPNSFSPMMMAMMMRGKAVASTHAVAPPAPVVAAPPTHHMHQGQLAPDNEDDLFYRPPPLAGTRHFSCPAAGSSAPGAGGAGAEAPNASASGVGYQSASGMPVRGPMQRAGPTFPDGSPTHRVMESPPSSPRRLWSLPGFPAPAIRNRLPSEGDRA